MSPCLCVRCSLFGRCPRTVQLDPLVGLFSAFWGNATLIPILVDKFALPPAMGKCSLYPESLPAWAVICSVNLGHPEWGEMKSQCGFSLFPWWVRMFNILKVFLNHLWERALFSFILHFKIGLFSWYSGFMLFFFRSGRCLWRPNTTITPRYETRYKTDPVGPVVSFQRQAEGGDHHENVEAVTNLCGGLALHGGYCELLILLLI